MNPILSITLVSMLALLFGWLAARAWRTQRALVKWPGVIIAGLLAIGLLLMAAVAAFGLYRLNRSVAGPAPDIQVAGSSEQLARGERLAHLCVICHSSSGTLPLDGAVENIVPELGTLYPPNLTPGGPLQHWTDGEIIRAIREGVHQNQRSLLLMPADQYYHMSEADVQSLVAYLRSQPAVERQTPETELNFLGALVVGAGVFPTSAQPPRSGPVEAPPAGPTPAYGQYLVTISGCEACHGQGLSGGTDEFVPSGPNLPAIVSRWSADEFVETMRTGVDAFGHPINPETMPWQDYSAAYTDEELKAIYEYIRSLSPAQEPSASGQ